MQLGSVETVETQSRRAVPRGDDAAGALQAPQQRRVWSGSSRSRPPSVSFRAVRKEVKARSDPSPKVLLSGSRSDPSPKVLLSGSRSATTYLQAALQRFPWVRPTHVRKAKRTTRAEKNSVSRVKRTPDRRRRWESNSQKRCKLTTCASQGIPALAERDRRFRFASNRCAVHSDFRWEPDRARIARSLTIR